MAKYTTSVRSICEVNSGLEESKGQASVNDIIANSRDKIFDFSYPIYDEDYRSVLETKILKHYNMIKCVLKLMLKFDKIILLLALQ